MTRFVSLASDHLGTYAALLPIAAKLWEALGYTPIVHHSLRGTNRFESAVLDWTVGRRFKIDAKPPLTLPNTMRAIRLYAWECADRDDDVVVTSDADMFPLDRRFFREAPDYAVLRALWYKWLGGGGKEPTLEPERLEWGMPLTMRFPMCYATAPVAVWRDLFPTDAARADKFGAGTLWPLLDDVSWDEAALTGRIIMRESGKPFRGLGRGRWQKGDLTLIDPLDAPLLAVYQDMPRGMIVLGDGWKPEQGPPPEGAIDFIPPRFTKHDPSWWIFDAVEAYWPELSSWLADYRASLETVIGDAEWR